MDQVPGCQSAQVVSGQSCFLADEVAPGTDVVSIKRVAGAEAGVFRDGGVYLRTNGTVGLLYRQPLTGTPAVTLAHATNAGSTGSYSFE